MQNPILTTTIACEHPDFTGTFTVFVWYATSERIDPSLTPKDARFSVQGSGTSRGKLVHITGRSYFRGDSTPSMGWGSRWDIIVSRNPHTGRNCGEQDFVRDVIGAEIDQWFRANGTELRAAMRAQWLREMVTIQEKAITELSDTLLKRHDTLKALRSAEA